MLECCAIQLQTAYNDEVKQPYLQQHEQALPPGGAQPPAYGTPVAAGAHNGNIVTQGQDVLVWVLFGAYGQLPLAIGLATCNACWHVLLTRYWLGNC